MTTVATWFTWDKMFQNSFSDQHPDAEYTSCYFNRLAHLSSSAKLFANWSNISNTSFGFSSPIQ